MDSLPLNNKSPYGGMCIVLTTKHRKGEAIGLPFRNKLGVAIDECNLDTDTLGTFSGEVNRNGNALDCVRRKCEWGIEQNGADYGLANEGSFGPHHSIPFLACDHEILYFIDRKRDFHLHLSHSSAKTNYRMEVIDSFENLKKFAQQALFPSHALIIRPNIWNDKKVIFKGIQSYDRLEKAFQEALKSSWDGKVWVETDMRLDAKNY